MRYSDIYAGLKVRANSKEEHKRNPRYYPRKGTKGIVFAIEGINVWVLWKKGTAIPNATWAVYSDFIEPAKGYWWRRWKRIFVKSKR